MNRRSFAGWILCAFTLLQADALTCSCVWSGPFVTVAAKESLIVRARVVRYAAHAMDVEVRETFKGESAATIRIWGDNGFQCRPYVTSFPVGTEWVFAVRTNPEGTEDGYVISGCGEYAVRVEKDSVSGRLTPAASPATAPETMSLNELRRRLKASVP